MKVADLLLEVATEADIQDALRRFRKSSEYDDAIEHGFKDEGVHKYQYGGQYFLFAHENGEKIQIGIGDRAAYSENARRQHHASEIGREMVNKLALYLGEYERKLRKKNAEQITSFIHDAFNEQRLGTVKSNLADDYFYLSWDLADPVNNDEELQRTMRAAARKVGLETSDHGGAYSFSIHRGEDSQAHVLLYQRQGTKLDLHSLHADPAVLDKGDKTLESLAKKFVEASLDAGIPREMFSWPLKIDIDQKSGSWSTAKIALDKAFRADQRPVMTGSAVTFAKKLLAKGVAAGKINLDIFADPLEVKSYKQFVRKYVDNPGIKIKLKDF